MARKPKKMRKAEFVEHWAGLARKKVIKVKPVAYKHKGSTFDEDGIRITGSPEFVDAVLSRISDMLEHENELTRLQVAYQPVKDRETGMPTRAVSCYVQVHERGPEAQAIGLWTSAICGKRAKI